MLHHPSFLSSISRASSSAISRSALLCRHLCSDLLQTPDSETSSEPVDLRTHTHDELRSIGKSSDVRSKLTTAHLCVLGTGGNELNPCFFLNCTNRTYLFNHVEGLKRMIEMHRIGLKSSLTLFTCANWHNMCGSLGAYYSLVEKYVELKEQEFNRIKQQAYCGPKDITQYMQLMSYFTGRNTWKNVTEYVPNEPSTIKDENMDVTIVHLTDSEVVYSCKMADWMGRFLPEKAVELGIPFGPAYKVLTSGRSVITKQGDLVRPAQVMVDAKIGPTFLVVDCPNMEVAKALTSNRYLEPEGYKGRGESVALIVHMTPLEVLQSEQYCEWVAGFGADTKHLLLHASVCPGEVSYRTAMSFSLPLHLMNPNVYQLPCVPDKNHINKAELSLTKHIPDDSITFGRGLLNFHLKPSLRVDDSLCCSPIEEEVKQLLPTIKSRRSLAKCISEHRELISLPPSWEAGSVMSALTPSSRSNLEPQDPEDIQITILGTSSSTSTKTRNVSGILLQSSRDGNLLLDCGEGTLCQLYQRFGVKHTEEVLRRLRLIFISHQHPDHYAGVPTILSEIGRVASGDEHFQPVTLLCDAWYGKILQQNDRRLLEGIPCEFADLRDAIRQPLSLGSVTLQAVPVRHIRGSCGIVVRTAGGKSVVYSGDTMPCKSLIAAGKDATLLIHEATLDNNMRAESREKLHCTMEDAVMVSRAMHARFTLTTHFSVRYVMSPLLYPWGKNVAPAVDLMTFRLSDLHRQGLDARTCRPLYFSMKDWAYKHVDGIGFAQE